MKKKNAIILSAVIGCAIIALVIAQTDPTGDASNQSPTPAEMDKMFDNSDQIKKLDDFVKKIEEENEERRKQAGM